MIMDDLRQRARAAYDRALAQKNLKERMSSRMTLAHAGGLWICDPTLIATLESYMHETEIVLLDSQDIPRKIKVDELQYLVKQRHQEIMNEWLMEYAELSKIRTAKDA